MMPSFLLRFLISANSQICREKLSTAIGHILATLHKNNIVHGDLTTSNILVHDDDVVRACRELQVGGKSYV